MAAFEAMMMRADCEQGFFVWCDYSSDAWPEIESCFKRSRKVIIALTVREILDVRLAKKLIWKLSALTLALSPGEREHLAHGFVFSTSRPANPAAGISQNAGNVKALPMNPKVGQASRLPQSAPPTASSR